jgi:CDP-glycerol glycerophosphotransferase
MFSIVVPVHNVRAYLHECIDSILEQSFVDFELIAVDDASPDDSGAVLDDYAATDPRVRVIHLERNVGLGGARQVGVDAASGRYLLFVDSDDTVPPGSLAAVADRIAATDDPEVVIFDFARTDSTGGVQRDGQLAAMTASDPDVFALDVHPTLLRLLFVVWNKAYRLDWVRAHGFAFSSGYYEDAPWTYPIMMTAARIAALDRDCYHYRQKRQGSILRSTNVGHFDAFDQYGRVFDYLDAHPELDRWRPLMFERMLRHLVSVQGERDRIPADMREAFFLQAAGVYRQHRPAGYVVPRGRGGIWARVFARGNYRIFQAAQVVFGLTRSVARAKTALTGKARRITRLGGKAGARLYYRAQLRAPIDADLAAYAAYWARGYACSPAAIYEAARTLAPRIRGVWVVRADAADAMPAGVPFVVENTRAYYRLMARAKYFVNNVNFASTIVKRPGSVHVQTQHGTPIKTMGMGLKKYPVAAAGMDFDRLAERCSRWDYLISSNRYSSDVWRQSYPGTYEMLEVGLPRNDRLVNATAADVAAVRAGLGLSDERTVVLYAPTFRDGADSAFDAAVDLQKLCERLGDDFTVLVRGHYLTESDESIRALVERGLLRDVSDYPVVEDLLLAADVLLTDYSSIMFDYANLDRPIAIYAHDWDNYVKVRGVTYDLPAGPPGVVETTQDGLVEALVSGRYRDAAATEARRLFRDKFCEFDDGHAAEQVVRRTFLGEGPADRGSD